MPETLEPSMDKDQNIDGAKNEPASEKPDENNKDYREALLPPAQQNKLNDYRRRQLNPSYPELTDDEREEFKQLSNEANIVKTGPPLNDAEKSELIELRKEQITSPDFPNDKSKRLVELSSRETSSKAEK